MPRYKITIEYDGTDFSGWQRQQGAYSVQQALEEAITKLSGEQPVVHGSGRTDAGVHAKGQVAHFDLEKEFSAFTIQEGLNHYLRPNLAAIISSEIVDNNFHARFSAKKRYYEYIIINRHPPLIIDQNRAWHVINKLSVEKMLNSAQALLGSHDFTSFRATYCQAQSPVKTLDTIDITRNGEYIHFHLAAQSFLHHMVRNIVGTLKLAGEGKLDAMQIKSILEAKDRQMAGPTAPAYGLYLTKITY